jgi:hypothetical protein
MKQEFIGVRIDKNLLNFIKDQTYPGSNMSETIRNMIAQIKPMPAIVYEGLKVIEKEYGLPKDEIISRAVLAYLARCNAEIELFGHEWGVDPFTLDVGEGKILENHAEFYGALFQARIDALLEVDFFRKKHEAYLASNHEIKDVRKKN